MVEQPDHPEFEPQPKPRFIELLERKWQEDKFVCVGLDIRAPRIPAEYNGGCETERLLAFNEAIVRATIDVAAAYKPNAAFYEGLSTATGPEVLRQTIALIKELDPKMPVIYDAKRGDSGSSNEGYTSSAFDQLGADAITIHPTMGMEAYRPFFDRADKGVVILAKTSNKGAEEFQDLPVLLDLTRARELGLAQSNDIGVERSVPVPLHQVIAASVARRWNYNGNCALVVGATTPAELGRIRNLVGDLPILAPGIGVQGGDLEQTVRLGQDSRGWGLLINSSRGLIYPEIQVGQSHATAVREAALDLHVRINEIKEAS